MGMSFSTAEEKKQVRWFVMRAYKNEKMAEDRLKDKEYGLEYFIPKHYAVRIYHGVKSTRLVPVIPSLVFATPATRRSPNSRNGTTSCNSPCGKKAWVWNISPCRTTRWTVSSK